MNGQRYARRLQRAAARLARVDVRFVGYASTQPAPGQASKWELLAAADVFVSTSGYEAYGLGLAQALASGTPVLASAHAGARAILGDDPGLGRVVEPAPRALARGLAEFLARAARRGAWRRPSGAGVIPSRPASRRSWPASTSSCSRRRPC